MQQLSYCHDPPQHGQIKACFCFARIHAVFTCGLIADNLYILVTAIAFGSTTSASSWEAFWQAIKALTKVFTNRPDLVIKHKKYLDMLKWEEIDPHILITRAFSCDMNQGIINKNGNCLDIPAHIYVNDALMLAINRADMEIVLTVTIKAIFIAMCKPNVAVRQCPLAMDKWSELVIGPKQTMLGLIINTNKLTIAIP
jgi:hypothetical protein